MNISFEKSSEAQGLLTLKLEKADYSENVEKSLKAYRQKANMPGFRPGMVPIGLVRKMYGKAIKAEEVNKILQEKVFEYLKENKIEMLGEPLANQEKEDGQDFEADDLTFFFDIALAPKIEVDLAKEDSLPYYEIKIGDDMVDNQVKTYTQRNGKYEKTDSYQDNDMLKGELIELNADGALKENGIKVQEAVLMPLYFKEDDQKTLFANSKVGDKIIFNPGKAYQNNAVELASLFKLKKEESEGIQSDFAYTISEITRYVEGELNQEIFDQVLGKDVVKSEEEFRNKIKQTLTESYLSDSDYKFLLDVRSLLMERAGKLKFADDLLKRIMLNNSKDGDMASVEANYESSVEELSWHLVKEKLVEKYAVKVDDSDIIAQAKEATKSQFAQYGMVNIPDDVLEKYAKEMLQKRETVDNLVNRSIEKRLAAALKSDVKLKIKKVSLEEFNKLFESKDGSKVKE